MNAMVSGYSIISPSTSLSLPYLLSVAQKRLRDLRAVRRARAVERVDPERTLVVAMQRVLPGEAHAAMHLDRALACRDRGLRRVRLGGSRRELALRFPLRDAPRRPVRERARELRLDIGVRELVRDGLVSADGPAELLAGLRVLDAERERAAREADRLERERGQRAPSGTREDLRRGRRVREETGVIVIEDDSAQP